MIYTVVMQHPEHGDHHAIVEAGQPTTACIRACEEFWDDVHPDGGEADDSDIMAFIDAVICRCWEGRHSEVPTTKPVYTGGPDIEC
jgi:hypothetical protein